MQSRAPSFPIDHLADSVIELVIPAFRRWPLLFATNHKIDIAPGVAAHVASALYSEAWRAVAAVIAVACVAKR